MYINTQESNETERKKTQEKSHRCLSVDKFDFLGDSFIFVYSVNWSIQPVHSGK